MSPTIIKIKIQISFYKKIGRKNTTSFIDDFIKYEGAINLSIANIEMHAIKEDIRIIYFSFKIILFVFMLYPQS